MYASNSDLYEAMVKEGLEGRELEASVLLKAAGRLRASLSSLTSEPAMNDGGMEGALRLNQRIWTVFQAELGKPDHPMPQELRINLLRLSRCVDQTTFGLMMEPDSQRLEMLIRINESVAEGLLSKRQTGDHSEEAPAAEAVSVDFAA